MGEWDIGERTVERGRVGQREREGSRSDRVGERKRVYDIW